jgi:hypothetical protein
MFNVLPPQIDTEKGAIFFAPSTVNRPTTSVWLFRSRMASPCVTPSSTAVSRSYRRFAITFCEMPRARGIHRRGCGWRSVRSAAGSGASHQALARQARTSVAPGNGSKSNASPGELRPAWQGDAHGGVRPLACPPELMTQAMTSRRIPSRRACSDRRCGAPRSAVRRGTSTVTVPRSTIARHFAMRSMNARRSSHVPLVRWRKSRLKCRSAASSIGSRGLNRSSTACLSLFMASPRHCLTVSTSFPRVCPRAARSCACRAFTSAYELSTATRITPHQAGGQVPRAAPHWTGLGSSRHGCPALQPLRRQRSQAGRTGRPWRIRTSAAGSTAWAMTATRSLRAKEGLPPMRRAPPVPTIGSP